MLSDKILLVTKTSVLHIASSDAAYMVCFPAFLGVNMPFSIDSLSIKSESQKIKLDSNDIEFHENDTNNKKIFMFKDLVEQNPITVF